MSVLHRNARPPAAPPLEYSLLLTATLCLLAHVIAEDQRQIDEDARQQGIGEIEQQPVLYVEVPRGAHRQRDDYGANQQ